MLKLNLPEVKLKLENRNGQLFVWDFLRMRWVALTPEEWVRQHFTHWMVEVLGYPAARLGNEISLEQNGMKRRCDSVFYNQDGTPSIIIEYKAPHIVLTGKVLDQACRYNMELHVPLLIISNGIQHIAVRVKEDGTKDFLDAVPMYLQ